MRLCFHCFKRNEQFFPVFHKINALSERAVRFLHDKRIRKFLFDFFNGFFLDFFVLVVAQNPGERFRHRHVVVRQRDIS